jgi:beta-mannanase
MGARKALLFMAAASIASHIIPINAEGQRIPPANSNMNQITRNLLAYCQSLEGEAWLTGQEEKNGKLSGHAEKVHDRTGKWPAIRGWDIRFDNPDPTNSAIQWWEKGGLVTFSWHMGAPPLSDSYYHSKGNTPVSKVLTEGTDENTDYIDKLDRMSVRLKKLEDEGVPVLWRPWHEMNGTWFWWSKSGASEFCTLWIHMYRYFTEEKKINNLIWVWSGSFIPSAEWYPGDDYVDITGSDCYYDGQEEEKWLEVYTFYMV